LCGVALTPFTFPFVIEHLKYFTLIMIQILAGFFFKFILKSFKVAIFITVIFIIMNGVYDNFFIFAFKNIGNFGTIKSNIIAIISICICIKACTENSIRRAYIICYVMIAFLASLFSDWRFIALCQNNA